MEERVSHRSRFAYVIQTDGQKNDALNIAKRMSKTKKDIGEQSIKTDGGMLEVYAEGKKIALTNLRCFWAQPALNSFSETNVVIKWCASLDKLGHHWRVDQQHEECKGSRTTIISFTFFTVVIDMKRLLPWQTFRVGLS